LVLNAGRIIERGTFRELLDANGKFAEMWRLQQQEAEKSAVPAA
jgi:ATP-binding cassette subfamily B protein